jgi:hypothetical protein
LPIYHIVNHFEVKHEAILIAVERDSRCSQSQTKTHHCTLCKKVIIYPPSDDGGKKIKNPHKLRSTHKLCEDRDGTEGGAPDTLTRNGAHCDLYELSQRLENILKILHDEVRIEKQFPY